MHSIKWQIAPMVIPPVKVSTQEELAVLATAYTPCSEALNRISLRFKNPW